MGTDDPSSAYAKATRELGSHDTTTATTVAAAPTTLATGTPLFYLSLYLSLSRSPSSIFVSLSLSPIISFPAPNRPFPCSAVAHRELPRAAIRWQ